jgi:hypothetical protein
MPGGWQSACPSDRGGQRGTVIMGHVIQAGASRNTARQQVRTTRTHPQQVEQAAGVRILQASDVVGESSLEGRVTMAGYACLIRVTCSRTAR